jgi:hypothetical protein
MGMNDVGPADGSRERWYDRSRGVATHMANGAQDPNPKPALPPIIGIVAERDELAVNPPGQCPGELERIALAAAE